MITHRCPKCGGTFATQVQQPSLQCPYCSTVFQPAAQQPPQFGQQQAYYGGQQPYMQQQPVIGVFDAGPSGKSRGVAAIIAFFLGCLGIHYFYLGKTTAGLLTILLSIVTCGTWGVVILVQCIIFLTMTQEEFERKFVYSSKSFPVF